LKQIIIQKGTKRLRADYVAGYICTLDDDKDYLVEVKGCQSVRRIAQNKLMWLWLQQLVKFYRDHYGLNKRPEYFKFYYQALFLGYETIETVGAPISKLIGTSSLGVKEFAKFLENIKLSIESDDDYVGLLLKDPELMRYAIHGEKAA